MNDPSPLRRRALAALLPGLLALGCVAGPSPVDRVYRLPVPPPQQSRPAPLLPGTLEVERPTGDHLTRERAILSAQEDRSTEVRPYPYDLWSDSPTLLVQRALADYLREAEVAERVVVPEAGIHEDWVVTGHLGRLDQLTSDPPRVLVELDLRLTDVSRRRLALQRSYRVEQPADGAGVEPAVRAMGTAVASIFERFVADIESTR